MCDISFLGDAKVELNISSTVIAGVTVNGSCICSGAGKPRYIHVSTTGQNCTIGGASAVGTNINNFNITCLSSNVSINLECYVYSNNKPKRTAKQIEGNKQQPVQSWYMHFVSYSGIQTNNNQSIS